MESSAVGPVRRQAQGKGTLGYPHLSDIAAAQQRSDFLNSPGTPAALRIVGRQLSEIAGAGVLRQWAGEGWGPVGAPRLDCAVRGCKHAWCLASRGVAVVTSNLSVGYTVPEGC